MDCARYAHTNIYLCLECVQFLKCSLHKQFLFSNFGFTHIHRYIQYFPRILWTKSLAYSWGGIQTHDLCNARAASYQLDKIFISPLDQRSYLLWTTTLLLCGPSDARIWTLIRLSNPWGQISSCPLKLWKPMGPLRRPSRQSRLLHLDVTIKDVASWRASSAWMSQSYWLAKKSTSGKKMFILQRRFARWEYLIKLWRLWNWVELLCSSGIKIQKI